MNIQTEKLLQEAVQKGLSIAEKTGEFVIEQAPDLLREFYIWHITENILYIIIPALFLFAVYKFRIFVSQEEEDSFYCTKFRNRYYDTDDIGAPLYIIISIIAFTIGFLIITSSIFDLLQLILAPKLYLIEYFIN